MPWNFPVIGTDIYHIVQWFFIYSILGWVVESIYMSFCEKRWVNRGFIFVPICPIYGFGAVAAYFILEPLAGNYVVLFIAGSLLATGWEWFVAKVMLHIFGEVWWDYSNKPFNYKGILCLESSIAWGFYTIILFTFLHKGVMMMADSYSYKIGCVAAGILMVYYMIDFTIHLCKAKFPSVPRRARAFRDSLVNFYRG